MISLELVRPQHVSEDRWQQLQELQHTALLESDTKRTPEEIDRLVRWGDVGAFALEHINPNVLVGHGLREDQAFLNPRMAIARDGHVDVGMLYAAENVSGSPLERTLKRYVMRRKRYLWLREIAVLPEYRGQGIGRDMASLLLRSARPNQPLTMYPWADESLRSKAKEYGFRQTDPEPDDPRGVMVRMQADSVESVLAHL